MRRNEKMLELDPADKEDMAANFLMLQKNSTNSRNEWKERGQIPVAKETFTSRQRIKIFLNFECSEKSQEREI
jgi:hypothetical protein